MSSCGGSSSSSADAWRRRSHSVDDRYRYSESGDSCDRHLSNRGRERQRPDSDDGSRYRERYSVASVGMIRFNRSVRYFYVGVFYPSSLRSNTFSLIAYQLSHRSQAAACHLQGPDRHSQRAHSFSSVERSYQCHLPVVAPRSKLQRTLD